MKLRSWFAAQLIASIVGCAPSKVHSGAAGDVVPAEAPDSVPAWFRDDSSYTSSPGQGRFLRNVLSVLFVEGATQAEREQAITLVHGQVIGGEPLTDDDGFYYVRMQDDGTGAQLQQAADTLKTLPQVEVADLVPPGGRPR